MSRIFSLASFGFLLLCGLNDSARAVVNGEPVNESSPHAEALRSVIRLKIRISPCTGTYLGRGRILTAAHCLLMDGYPEDQAKICINDGLDKELTCVLPAQYTVTFPEKEKDGPKAPVRGSLPGMGKVIRIPIPDMAMVVLKDFEKSPELQATFGGLEPVLMGDFQSAENLQIAGQGCNNYLTYEGREVLRQGSVQMDALTDPSLATLTWLAKDSGNKWSGACPGDSGGPLFYWSAQGQLIQVGVTSYIKMKSDSNGLVSVTNAFGRVDGRSASAWLKGD
jgi:hypothetical protein